MNYDEYFKEQLFMVDKTKEEFLLFYMARNIVAEDEVYQFSANDVSPERLEMKVGSIKDAMEKVAVVVGQSIEIPQLAGYVYERSYNGIPIFQSPEYASKFEVKK